MRRLHEPTYWIRLVEGVDEGDLNCSIDYHPHGRTEPWWPPMIPTDAAGFNELPVQPEHDVIVKLRPVSLSDTDRNPL